MAYDFVDTHTHYDSDEFAQDREIQSIYAFNAGVKHLLLVGYLAKYFPRMVACQQQMQGFAKASITIPKAHLAFGLHPFYILEQSDVDLQVLEDFINRHSPIAVGEIGLDTFSDEMKQPDTYIRQQEFFRQQLSIAKSHKLPALLHIRRAHGDSLKILKQQKFDQGGIAHSFSGGIQEAKAFVDLGFKIGITGQVTNPNAKKLRNTIVALVKTVGIDSIVIETDCPDMLPTQLWQDTPMRNVPANLPYVFSELVTLLNIEPTVLAEQLWQNSMTALRINILT